MIVGLEKIDEAVAELKSALQEGTDDQVAIVDEVFIIAGLNFSQDEDSSIDVLGWRCSSSRVWVQKGLLVEAMKRVNDSMEQWEEDNG